MLLSSLRYKRCREAIDNRLPWIVGVSIKYIHREFTAIQDGTLRVPFFISIIRVVRIFSLG